MNDCNKFLPECSFEDSMRILTAVLPNIDNKDSFLDLLLFIGYNHQIDTTTIELITGSLKVDFLY